MPHTPSATSGTRKAEDILASVGITVDAYNFIHEGLTFAAEQTHGRQIGAGTDRSRHISGQQLCEGLRKIAVERWGYMAQAVLSTWGIHCTRDFGKIVFALIQAGQFQKQPNDTIEDFTDVYDFRKAFGTDYHITLSSKRA